MLKFLTHKLRTHSINEDNYIEKVDEDHDSGTESDDEIEDFEIPSLSAMSSNSSISPVDTGCSIGSPLDLLHDPHSSEEELEVINNPRDLHSSASCPLRRPTSSVCLAEKRKWSQISAADADSSRSGSSVGSIEHEHSIEGEQIEIENMENMSHFGNLSPRTMEVMSPYAFSPHSHHHSQHHHHNNNNNKQANELSGSGGSSDDEVHHLLASMATPVQFRTSPPLEAVKPARTNKGNFSPPHKLIHYEVSPRKRSRHTNTNRHSHVQRPCLDFEKMQQLKARSVTAWRNGGDHGGELSVFCW